MNSSDPDQKVLLDLFRQEVETQVRALNAGLLALERTPRAADQLEACMRAAHSIKGAARIVGLGAGVDVAHAIEDCFVSAQQGLLVIGIEQIDALLRGADLLARVANPPSNDINWADLAGREEIDRFLAMLAGQLAGTGEGPLQPNLADSDELPDQWMAAAMPSHSLLRGTDNESALQDTARDEDGLRENPGRVLRVTADNLNRLLSLSGESLVEARRLKPFSESLLRLKRLQGSTMLSLESVQEQLSAVALGETTRTALAELRRQLAECQHMLSNQLSELEAFDRHSVNLSQRLYDEALACRMRPFADTIGGYARMVRDLSRSLGKQARLQILGESTPVDRDILEQLDAPLGHLLRNAVDHGIEVPPYRRTVGKPEEGVITLEARHNAGMLQINIADDGAGIDLDQLRIGIVRRNLADRETVSQMSEAELLEFLLLPNFTTRDIVTEVSGRGVGLDVVSNIVKQLRGKIRLFNKHGAGMRIQLQLPLTQSVMRSLLVGIGGEPYAFPLAYVNRTLELRREQIEMLEGRQHFALDGRRIGMVDAQQVLQNGEPAQHGDTIPVLVIGDQDNMYGLVVERFLGERMLVVQPLDQRLGKVKDIAAGALQEDGSPILIIDVDDIVRSVEKLVSTGRLDRLQDARGTVATLRRKRILVVDDSLTVRELERKLLTNRGYEVVVAVDGMDGWNALRTEAFDLVLTDIDMPRMDGIELVTLIKKDHKLQSTPVMIVSYKDREEDRRRGLDAGADYYLAKGSFDDERLLQVVLDLIGEAQE